MTVVKKEAEICQYLRATYNPVAILLHGSRANGMHRPRSDWDIFLLFREMPSLTFNREVIAGEDVDWRAIRTPVPNGALLATVGDWLQFAKVLWEKGNAGTVLLKEATNLYAKGRQLSKIQRDSLRQSMIHRISGMEDYIDVPYMYLMHLCFFFRKAIDAWLQLRGQYYKPFYIAMPKIAKEDPECYALLMMLFSAGSESEKIRAARRVVEKLFVRKYRSEIGASKT